MSAVGIELRAIVTCCCADVSSSDSGGRGAQEDGDAGRRLWLHETTAAHSCRVGQVHTKLLWAAARRSGTGTFSVQLYRVAQKLAQFLYAVTLPNINRFSKLFHCRFRRKFVIILSLKIWSHLKCVATVPCEMLSVLETTIGNKTISVTTNNTL